MACNPNSYSILLMQGKINTIALKSFIRHELVVMYVASNKRPISHFLRAFIVSRLLGHF
jgi:hypothetical protein